MDKITTSLAEKVSWRHETGSFLLPHKTHAEVESITHAHLTDHCSLLNVENKNGHSDSEKCNKYRPYGKRRRLVVEDGNLSGEKAVHVEVKSSQEDKANPSSILGQQCHFLSQRNMKPVWRQEFYLSFRFYFFLVLFWDSFCVCVCYTFGLEFNYVGLSN